MKIRTITGLLSWPARQDFSELMELINSWKAIFEQSGYEVQTIRLTTDLIESSNTLGELSAGCDELARMTAGLDLSEVHLGSFGVAHDLVFDQDVPAVISGLLHDHPNFNACVDLGDDWPVDYKRCHRAAELCQSIAEKDPFDCFRFGVFAYVRESTPFYPASRVHTNHGRLAIGLQSSSLANAILDLYPEQPVLSDTARVEQFRSDLVRSIEQVSGEIGGLVPAVDLQRLLGFDTSLAPFPDDDYSIGRVIERISGSRFGETGTLSACKLLTSCMKENQVTRTGLNGLMLPPLEDHILAERYREKTYSLKDLLLFSTVCATGLDTIVLSDTERGESIAGLYQDLGNLAVSLTKPLSARLMLVPGHKAGDMVHFDSEYVCDCPVMALD